MNDPKHYYLLDYLDFRIEQDKIFKKKIKRKCVKRGVGE